MRSKASRFQKTFVQRKIQLLLLFSIISSWYNAHVGDLKGSAFGPTLLLYINDLPYYCVCKTGIFTGDSTLDILCLIGHLNCDNSQSCLLNLNMTYCGEGYKLGC